MKNLKIKGFEVILNGSAIELVKEGSRKALLNINKKQELENSEIAVYFIKTYDELKGTPGIKMTKEEYGIVSGLYRNKVQEYLGILNSKSEISVEEYQGHFYLSESNNFELTNKEAKQEALGLWLNENKKYLVLIKETKSGYEAITYCYSFQKENISKIDTKIEEKKLEVLASAEYIEQKERAEKLFKWALEYDERTFNEMTGLDRSDYR